MRHFVVWDTGFSDKVIFVNVNTTSATLASATEPIFDCRRKVILETTVIFMRWKLAYPLEDKRGAINADLREWDTFQLMVWDTNSSNINMVFVKFSILTSRAWATAPIFDGGRILQEVFSHGKYLITGRTRTTSRLCAEYSNKRTAKIRQN